MEPLRILLVEDNPDDEVLVVREIRRGGYDVTHKRVETAPEMLKALQDEPWDLIVSDFSLPSFNAPEAVQVLKKSGLDIPIIIVSGTVGEDTAVAALKAGAHDFLSKNSMGRLLPAIEREMREARSRNARRQDRARLRASEEALGAVIGASPLPIITVDTKARITGWNVASENTFGWSAVEAVGKTLDIITDRSNDRWYSDILDGARVSRMEISARDRSGRDMQMLVFAAPLHNESGNVTGAVCIINDITDQRALEEQLRQAQKMEAIGRLAGGIAHDFNNILTAIQGYATLLQAEVPSQSHSRGDVDGILDAAARASAFTRQLLAFSRKQVTQPELIDINELISSMLSMLGRVIGVEYMLSFVAGDVKAVYADRGQLGQVVLNLVVNARDSMRGGGTIYITTEMREDKPENRVRTQGDEHTGPFTVLNVRDTGHGIPPEVVSRIFEPFFTTKDITKGTGLGLSTVYGIVTQHEGFISVDSTSAGTNFAIYLPGRDGTQAAPSPVSERADNPHTSATIILVEDDRGIRQLLERALGRAGFTVHAAEDGETAVEVIRNHGDANVLITDLMLPGMSGADLIEHVSEKHPGVRSILMSGYASEDNAIASGVTYVEKPFSPDQLITAVRRVLNL
jgi:PAS domain S-box-containing protein